MFILSNNWGTSTCLDKAKGLITFWKNSSESKPFNLLAAWTWILYNLKLARIRLTNCTKKKHKNKTKEFLNFRKLGQYFIHLIWSFSLVFVVLEIHSIVTILQFVLGHPLGEIISSLRCYTCHFAVPTFQVNLEPLVNIVASSWPRSRFAWSCFKMKSAMDNGMIGIQLRRSTYLTIRDWAIFHAKSGTTS